MSAFAHFAQRLTQRFKSLSPLQLLVCSRPAGGGSTSLSLSWGLVDRLKVGFTGNHVGHPTRHIEGHMEAPAPPNHYLVSHSFGFPLFPKQGVGSVKQIDEFA